jgi:hypothetical protein
MVIGLKVQPIIVNNQSQNFDQTGERLLGSSMRWSPKSKKEQLNTKIAPR